MITTFYMPTRIILGAGSLKQLGAEAKALGKNAMLVTYQSGFPKELLDRAVQDLRSNGVEVIVFDKVMPNPRTSMVDEGAELVRQKKIDLVIGIGGGSAMDSAKGIMLAGGGGKSILEYLGVPVKIDKPLPALVMVPTLAATSSESNCYASLTNWEKRKKLLLYTPYIFPKLAIIDSEMMVTAPKRETARGGVDIFCHAMEAYITGAVPSPITDGILETSMRTAVDATPKALAKPDDLEARTQICWANLLANSPTVGLGGGNGPLTMHGICTPLSGYFDAVHADVLAAMLIAWMKFTQPARPDRFRSLGKNVFGQEDSIAALGDWLKKLGMSLRLRDLGIKPDIFKEVAGFLVSAGRTKGHPNLLDEAAVIKIYEESY